MSRAAITITLAGAAVLAVGVGSAGAQGLGTSRGYFKVFGGATLPQDDSFDLTFPAADTTVDSGLNYSTGYVFGVAGGYLVTPALGIELEYAYRSGDADIESSSGTSGRLHTNTYMANAVYTFNPVDAAGVWKPYVGVGLGATDLTYEPDAPGRLGADLGFAYQVMGGIGYQVNESWTLSGEVRYFATTKETVSNANASFDTTFQTIDALVGATYRF